MTNRTASTNPAATVDGLRFILVQEDHGVEYVQRYEPADMAEVFTADELAVLDRGEELFRLHRLGASRMIDMVIAARIGLGEIA